MERDAVDVDLGHPVDVDLGHHGDRDVAPGLIDLAVNVRPARTPSWLVEAVTADADWAAYPDPRPATAALARHLRVEVDQVLLTAGGAEAFTLIARGLPARAPVVVHPQFTEPEAALRAAGRDVRRVLLSASEGFRLAGPGPGGVPESADLVLVGNPTNPTSVLHPAAALRELRRPGRALVVDEAFMDAVPGEPETLIGPDMAGVLVLRSLTKTWGLAGLRVGYLVGDPDLVAQCAAQQPPWSVSTPALRAVLACLGERAATESARVARDAQLAREDLQRRLEAAGIAYVAPARAPFLLLDTSRCGDASVREPLAARGFAVRRGETFPGLGPTWVRVAVRDSAIHAELLAALVELQGSGDS